MSGNERRTEGSRLRRLLTRALVVTGAAAAGTATAWLLGSGLALAEPTLFDDADLSVEVVEKGSHDPVRPAEEAGRDEVELTDTDPAALELADLDAASIVVDAEELIPETATGPETGGSGTVLEPVSESVHGIVQQARPALEPVRKVTDGVLDTGHSLTETVETGLAPVERPLENIVSGASGALPGTSPDRDAPRPEPAPERKPSGQRDAPSVPHVKPVAPAPAPLPVAETTDTRTSSIPNVVVGDRNAADDGTTPAPGPLPWKPLVPLSIPTPPACGCTGDGSSPNGGVGLGWLLGAALLSEPRGSTTARRTTPALTGGPRPQPGTTPD